MPTDALDLAVNYSIAVAMMAVPVVLGISARIFFDSVLHVLHRIAK